MEIVLFFSYFLLIFLLVLKLIYAKKVHLVRYWFFSVNNAALRMTVNVACSVQEELETLLEESGHLRTLAFLYANKGINSKALAIWRVLARNCLSDAHEDPAETGDLTDSNTALVSGRETAAIEASKILEESADVDSILQHLGWVCYCLLNLICC